MAARTTRTNSQVGENIALALLSLAAAGAVIAAVSWWVGSWAAGLDTSVDPFTGLFDALRGWRPWPIQATMLTVMGAVSALAVTAAVVLRWV